ncbi:MAG TPA: hypothetical protein VIW45_09905, partial [Vicinamibacterales bacterium]
GTVLKLARAALDLNPSEQLIAHVSGALFALLCATIIVVAMRVLVRNRWSANAILLVLVFCVSPFVVMSAHLMGYYDHIFILLAIWSVALTIGGRIWTACALQVVAVLVHESAIVVGFPLVCLAWVHVNRRREAQGERALTGYPLLLPIAAFAAITLAPLPPGFERSFAARLSRFDFIDNQRDILVPRWLSTPLADSYSTTLFLDRALYTPAMHAVVLPSLFALLCFVVDGYRRSIWSIESALLLAAALAPQALHAVAWDTPRIGTYSIVCAFVICWVYAELYGPSEPVSPAVTLLCAITLALNVVTRTPLMDNERDRLPLGARLVLYAPFFALARGVARADGDS